MSHSLVQRHPGETESAPVRIEQQIELDATPHEAFEVLADHERWPSWYHGMRSVRIDGPAEGAGALRTVWLGRTRVQEQFVAWEEDSRLTLDVVDTNLPGLLTMKEDWSLTSLGRDRSLLRIVVTAEPSGFGRIVPWALRRVLRRATSGAEGLAEVFRVPRAMPTPLATAS